MKRCIAFLFVLLFIFTLCGCKKEVIEIASSDYISDIKLYVDDSYTGSDRLLYVTYTVTATDRNIEFFYYTQGQSSVGSGATVTLNGLNNYYDLFSANSALSKPFEITELKSPSEGQLIKVGEKVDFISAFIISDADISENGKLVLNLKATDKFNEKEEISLNELIHIQSGEILARSISPDGMTEEEKALAEEIEEIDKDTEEKLQKALKGTWEFTIEDIKTEMTFKDGKYTETQIKGEEDSSSKVTAKGTYSIRKKVILVSLNNGGQLRISYTYSDNTLKLSAPKTVS